MLGDGQDDVIRIRIDTGRAVHKFMTLLAEQAAQGETRAPANPANRAVFRELAPFRLVEFSYVDLSIGSISGVYFGFQNGAVFSVAEEIPEDLIDQLVSGDQTNLPPIYLYILLDQPIAAATIHGFMAALAQHVEDSLIGVYEDADHRIAAAAFGAIDAEHDALIRAEVAAAIHETDRHLDRQRVLDRFLGRTQAADGRAWALLVHRFEPRIVEFSSVAGRDNFIAWTATLCDRIHAGWGDWAQFSMDEMPRPAQLAPRPEGEVRATAITAPSDHPGGSAWQAFGRGDTAQPDEQKHVAEYWATVSAALDS